jgi:DNA-binding response OmpR family regulator
MDSKKLLDLTKDLSILYVEDDKDLAKKTTALLENFFEVTLVAYDGEEGLDLYNRYFNQNNKYIDIVISDIRMPKKDGIVFTKDIFAINSKQLIIILSAYDDSSYLIELLNSGVSKFISKPFSTEQLVDVLYGCCMDIKDIQLDKLVSLKDGYVWDKLNKALLKDSENIKLTKNEMMILDMFLNNPNQVFSEEMIFNTIYYDNIDKEMSGDSIKSILKRLRKKLPCDCIENIYGSGYRINVVSS